MKVGEVMTREVVTVEPATPVTEIGRLMWNHHLSGVPVVQDGRLVGIVSELDLLARDANLHAPNYLRVLDIMIPLGSKRHFDDEVRRALATTAGEVMTREVVATAPDVDLADAASLMLERRVNPLPVIDEQGRLVGIISRADFVRLLALDVPTE